MKALISTALLLVIAVCLTACRYNGNTTVNVTAPAGGEKGLAPYGDGRAASGAINIIITDNTATQDATKSVDAGKAAVSATNAQGASTANSGPATVTTPQPTVE